MMNEPQTATTEPPIQQQYAWSRVVHVELYGKCWHKWGPFVAIAAMRGQPKGSCRFYCAECEHRAVSMSTKFPPGGPNYCTHEKAWPALQKALALDMNVWHLGIVSQFPWKAADDDPDFGFGREPIIRDVQPWQIIKGIACMLECHIACPHPDCDIASGPIKAIAEELEAERERLTPGVKGKEPL